MKLKDYLLMEDGDKCLHCHKREKLKGRAICSKCTKELEKIKSKKKDD